MQTVTFTFPLLLDGAVLSEIDAKAEVLVTERGYRKTRRDPGAAPEWDIALTFVEGLIEDGKGGWKREWIAAPDYLKPHIMAYLATPEGTDLILECLEDGGEAYPLVGRYVHRLHPSRQIGDVTPPEAA